MDGCQAALVAGTTLGVDRYENLGNRSRTPLILLPVFVLFHLLPAGPITIYSTHVTFILLAPLPLLGVRNTLAYSRAEWLHDAE